MTKITKTNLNPTAGYILIQPVEATKKTDSGIYLPETSDEKPQKGKVLAVGADEILDNGKTRKSPVKKGDVVSEGDILCLLESMKMENPIVAPVGGTITEINIADGQVVEVGDVVAIIEY